jgi:type IX secretion system PorP/SprF family membrane protein
MNNMIRHSLHIIVVILIAGQIGAQTTPYSSIFNDVQFFWNPAMTANGESLIAGVFHRQQWLGIKDAPRTSAMHFQYPMLKQNMSVGGWILVDKAGPIQYFQMGGSYSYKVDLSGNSQLSFGISAYLNQHQFNGAGIIADDLNDPLLDENRNSVHAPNTGAGIYFVSNKKMYALQRNSFFVGLAANQLIPASIRFSTGSFPLAVEQYMSLHFNLGVRLVYNYAYYVEPSLWIDYSTTGNTLFRGVVHYELDEKFWGSLSLASDYTLGLQLGLIIPGNSRNGVFKIGGAGLYSIAQLGPYQGPGFEFQFIYQRLQ